MTTSPPLVWSTKVFPIPVDLAYGAEAQFTTLFNLAITGTIRRSIPILSPANSDISTKRTTFNIKYSIRTSPPLVPNLESFIISSIFCLLL